MVLALMLLAIACYVYQMLAGTAVHVTFPPNTSLEGCVKLSGPIGGEDGVLFANRVLIVSELDCIGTEFAGARHGGGPALTPDGRLWALDLVGTVRHPRLLALDVPLPEGVAFHAHGLGLFEDTLFVVNHAYARGGERIERFKLALTEDGSAAPVSLEHISSLRLPDELMGTVNAVAPTSKNEFFFTMWRDWQSPPEGPGSVAEESVLWVVTKIVVPRLRKCRVWRCALVDGWECAPIGPAAVTYNGIAASHAPGAQLLYVNEPAHKRILEYEILRPVGGSVSLVQRREFLLPHAVDNIQLDEDANAIWTGSLPNALGFGEMTHKTLARAQAAREVALAAGATTYSRRPWEFMRPTPDAPPDPAIQWGVLKVDLATGESTDVIMQTDLLVHVSWARATNDSIVFGSAVDDGLIICPEHRPPVVENKGWVRVEL